jgi:hypothetical protein
MSEQNKQQSQDNNSRDYNEMNLNELKEFATERGIAPEGNKSTKETWVQALEKANTKSEDRLSDFKPKIEGEIGSLDARETIYEEVLQKLEGRGVDLTNTSVTFDGVEALSYKNNNVSNRLSDSQAQLLQSALNDPQNFKGSVEIKSGNRVLLKIENGSVARDTIGLTAKKTTVAVEASTKDLYEKYSQNARGKGLAKTKEVAQNAIADGMSGEQTKKVIRLEDGGFRDYKEQQGEQIADKNLERIVNQAIAQQQVLKQQQHEKEKQKDKNQELTATR